ncbi:unnamed protein product [Rangifer tarandus platyrhynchus]|uniref:Uncharacterized protein n=1 Tax=Rangifer tarandus platyrhynchus TaxID=3082113 RepID=A0ABN9A6W5_RANTA|nr:unnamed protein product [Rangifer tarandus platyrhynchus]
MLLLPIFLVVYRTRPPVDTVAVQCHIGRAGVSSLSPGDQIYPFFRIQFRGVRLDLLAPICKREKKATSALFLPEASLPTLDGGVDRLYTKAFLSWSDLVCPLQTQATYLFLPVLPPRWGGDAPGVDLMASLTDVQLLTIKTLFAPDATRGAIRVTFWNASQAKTAGGNIRHLGACARP